MELSTWKTQYKTVELNEPTAVVGSSGFRSIGKLVVNHLINELKPQLIAELHSIHFPLIYQTKPAYFPDPELPGVGGVEIKSGMVDMPSVQFYAHPHPPLIITKGYHANFSGQYEVAEKVIEFFKELRVRRIIIVAGYGSKMKKICCAATDKKIIEETKAKFQIQVDYKGPFYGFSGLVFGLAKLTGIEALCLLVSAEPVPTDPEAPDEESSKMLLNKLNQILDLHS
jgi:proteasome assembly chaperone (PAC2) family protein